MAVYLVFGLIILALAYTVSIYNNAVRSKNEVEKAFGSVDVMLKKRYDLIPNLVETVKQYAKHEASVFNTVTQTRAQLTDQLPASEKIELHNNLFRQMKGMMLTVENYPDLKANQNFLKLQAAWNEAEEQISAARRYYNAAVTEYNNAIQTFPANIMIDAKKFSAKKVLEIEVEERNNISAKTLFNS
jgi:LemA protein